MKKLLLIFLLCLPALSFAQGWNIDWYGSLRAAGSTGEYMPFWSRTGEDGILPVRSSGLLTAGADVSYRHTNGLFFEAGTNLAGVLALQSPLNTKSVYGLVDRLYISGGWKMLHLDLGMRPRERQLSELSISGGNFVYSRNARNMPGVNIWSDWIYFDKKHIVGIKGNISHYQTIDNRYVSRTMIHNKALALKFALGSKVDLSLEFEHWAQWGGVSRNQNVGYQPVSFKDYLRIFLAGSGGENATNSDKINVLGNHLGRECIRVDWKHDSFIMTFIYDKPFEDGSGIRYQNAPDGIWSVQYESRNRNSIVTDVVLEYIQTTWQSGTEHDRPAITEEEWADREPDDPYYGRVVIGGCDTYFSNGEYRSGWTYYNRIIGLPLIIPAMPDDQGVTCGVVSTRLRGVHLGMKGMLTEKVPYALKATYTANFGNYKQSKDSVFEHRPWQVSLALESGWIQPFKLPLNITLGLYGDWGQLYQNSFGVTLKLSYSGRIGF